MKTNSTARNIEIDENIILAIRKFINLEDIAISTFSLSVGCSNSSVSKWINDYEQGKPRTIRRETWAKLYNKISSYLPNDPKYHPQILPPTTSAISSESSHIIGHNPTTIANTAALRECIKDAMMEKGIRGADGLTKLIGYDSKNTIERLLSGKLNWFPDVLSCVLEKLEIPQDNAPISNAERMLLMPEGSYSFGGMLVRPIPVVDWCNASSCFDSILSGDDTTMKKWNPETTETVAVPVGTRKGTIAFRVHGISMEPTLVNGDRITVEPRSISEIPNGKIVVVHFADCAKYAECSVCKRFRRVGVTILLTSDSPAGAEIETNASEIAWIGLVTDYVRSI